MERVDLELSAFTRRAGSVLVAHSDTTLARGLEPGERVLVRDRCAGYRLATVRDISFDLTDTHYRFELGAEVSTEEAALIAREPQTAVGGIDLSDVLALLHEARALVAERSHSARTLRR